MAIGLDERMLTLADAARMLPKRRRGKKPHVATLYRWSSRGIGGVVLESIQMGGTRCTSVEALDRFFRTLSEQRNRRKHAPTPRRDPDIAHAERVLDQAGIGTPTDMTDHTP